MGTVLCKHGEMEGEIREKAVKGRSVIGSLSKGYEKEECVHGGKERIKE